MKCSMALEETLTAHGKLVMQMPTIADKHMFNPFLNEWAIINYRFLFSGST